MTLDNKELILKAIEQEIADRRLTNGDGTHIPASKELLEQFHYESKALHLAYRIVADYDLYISGKQAVMPKYHRTGEAI